MTDAASRTRLDAPRRRGAVGWLLSFSQPLFMIVMELAVYAVEPRVMSARDIVNALNRSSNLVLFAAAQLMVILMRGFDLSLDASVSAVSAAAASAMTRLVGAGA